MDGRHLVQHDGSHREHHQPVGMYFVLALICGAFVAISSEFNRRGFLSPEKLERTLGIPVLVSIPDSRALRHSGGAPPQSLPG